MPRLTKKKVHARMENIKTIAGEISLETARLFEICGRNNGKPVGREFFDFETQEIVINLNGARHALELANRYLNDQFPKEENECTDK